jgi:hypothetical protein
MVEELTNIHTKASSMNNREQPRILEEWEKNYKQNMQIVKQAINEQYLMN